MNTKTLHRPMESALGPEQETHTDFCQQNQHPAPRWAKRLQEFNYGLVEDFGGGPRPWKLAWVINFQKLTTSIFLIALMLWYADASPQATGSAAWIFLALHGTYGFVWLLKDMAFPDPGWQTRVTIGGGLNAFAMVLGPYWIFGWLLISGHARASYPLAEPVWFALCVSLCIMGCVLMIAADAQKFFTLRIQRGLIRDGVHRYIRHPNYLGEMLIYLSLALMVWHWIPAAILAYVWLGIFLPNILCKEASLSRHPGWDQYRKRSWLLLPGLV